MKNIELKPFNLQEALDGKAVKLRNGDKAFVRHRETEIGTTPDCELLGYNECGITITWSIDGQHILGIQSPYDILGMFQETKVINGFEVPIPETSPLSYDTFYYTPHLSDENFYVGHHWIDDVVDKRLLQRGLVFIRKEHAVATAKAMLGIDPYPKPYETKVIHEACMTKAGLQIRFKQQEIDK